MILYICIQSQAYLHNIIWYMHLRHHQCIYVSYRMVLLSIVYNIYMNIIVWYIYMNIHYCVYTYMWSQPYSINWFRTYNLMLNTVYQTNIPLIMNEYHECTSGLKFGSVSFRKENQHPTSEGHDDRGVGVWLPMNQFPWGCPNFLHAIVRGHEVIHKYRALHCPNPHK